ncbi:MAG: ImmA/IrrE family metallo-endopeptidase [Firmicutes bacterium]|nr:ImmA/IrrE family metallo-endopeptidase [Bacillota bacterium]
MLTSKDLAARLKEARERTGLTQEEAAQFLGLARSAIALIETGKRKVSGLELARLAYLYGRSPSDFFDSEFAADGVSVLLRALPETTDQEETKEAIRQGIALAREIDNLEHLLGVERVTAILPRFSTISLRGRWEAVEQGKHLAHQERQRLELGSAPVDDMGDLMENQGITVLELELPDQLSGFTIRLNGSVVCGVNVSHAAERRRFSLTHEYCHALMDHDRQGIVSRQEESDELREVRANAFAAAFLMPEDGIRDYLLRLNKGLPSRPREAVVPPEGDVLFVEGRLGAETSGIGLWHVCLLTNHFSVSRLAMIWRLFNLKLITEKERDNLLAAEQDGSGRALSRILGMNMDIENSHKIQEADTDHIDKGRSAIPAKLRLARRRILHLALEALRLEIISRGKFRELARLAGFDLDELQPMLEKIEVSSEPLGPESEG